MKLLPIVLLFVTAALTAQIKYPEYNPEDIDIPFTKYVLPNGLRLVVHEDHKAPIVAVNIWYHVGSKNEKAGKSGFAHLFEHLMFNGSEHYNKDYFQALESIGATDLNGTTNEDRTNYFQNVPVGALDQVLFLESDRMGHLLGAIDQGKLDEQRGVVQNEKRQGENQPYSKGWDIMQKEMFPPHHPYGHTVIGEMEDLNAASLEDVHNWFKTYYGAANAVVVMAGDITPQEAYAKVLKYFGNIPAGPMLSQPGVNINKRTQETRTTYQDQVPESRIQMVWNVPEWGSIGSTHGEMLAAILGSGKNSRLYKALVYEKQIASSVSCFSWSAEIAGNFMIQANVKQGKTVEEVEKAIIEILNDVIKNGVKEDELKRVRAASFASLIKGLERIGGFGGKSDILAENEVFGGKPDYYKTQLLRMNTATVNDLHQFSKDWLSEGKFTLICNPFPTYEVTGSETDRSELPKVDPNVTTSFPALERATLKNGMKVVLTRRTESPIVVANMMFDAGYSTDKMMGKLGLSNLSMNMMDEGTKNLSSLEINERLQLFGASLSTASDLDYSYVNLNALKASFDQSLELMADVVLNPSFPDSEFKRLKSEQLSRIQNEMKNPISMALRVLPEYLYGKDHPYGIPSSGTGNEESVNAIMASDVNAYYKQWIKPNNATIVVTGDISMPELVQKLEAQFGKWEKGTTPKKVIPEVKEANGRGKLYLIDKPESQQSLILAGYLTNPYGKMDETSIEQMSAVLGGDFTSRINMNLREDKHWSYGAGTFILETKGQRPFLVYAPVQTDKTSESLKEIMKEFDAITGPQPITLEEFNKSKQNTIMGLSGRWETNDAVNYSARNILKFGLKDDYWQTYSKHVQNLKLEDVRAVSKEMIQPEKLSWFMVGDAEVVLPTLKDSGLEVIQISADGKVVVPKQEKP